MSQGPLYCRLCDVTDRSPSALIRTIRLERAAQLLFRPAALVSEMAYGAGFKSASPFSRCVGR